MPRKTFEQWKASVDGWLFVNYGLGSDDLPDVAYADMYDDGYSPAEAAKEAVEQA